MAEIAARQHGVVSVTQLRAAGLDKHRVRHRVRTGRLHRVHRGVYAVGHTALPAQARFMAAVLACGSGSVVDRRGRPVTDADDCGGVDEDAWPTPLEHWGAAVSHRSAAELWGLLAPSGGVVDVTVPGDCGRKRRAGMRIHRSPTLEASDVTLRNAIPVTTAARTIADLQQAAGTPRREGLITARELRRALREAARLGLRTGDQPSDRTRSDLERLFLRICRRRRVPVPEVNVRIGPHLVDFLWRDARLVVETDGYRYHRGRAAFEDDRARDLDLRRRGYTVLRLSARQLEEEPETIAAAVREAVVRAP